MTIGAMDPALVARLSSDLSVRQAAFAASRVSKAADQAVQEIVARPSVDANLISGPATRQAQANKLIKNFLVPPGDMTRQVSELSVEPVDQNLFNFKGLLAQNKRYGERDFYRISGQADLSRGSVNLLDQALESIGHM